MTAQIHDTLEFRGARHMLVGVDGYGLFDPTAHGLEVHPTTTANWRGWAARYSFHEERLTLTDLHDVGLSWEQMQAPPLLYGVAPVQVSRGTFEYKALDQPIDYTGELLIARGFIQALYRHMGFHPAWKFEHSWALVLDGGRLTEARDTSDEMRALRERIEAGDVQDPDSPERQGWIGRTFRLDPRRSRGR